MRQMLRYPPFAEHDSAGRPRAVRGGRGGVRQAHCRSGVGAGSVAGPSGHGTADAAPGALGPAPCPFARLKGRYRFQIQVQGPDGEQLRAAVARPRPSLEPPENVQWIVDVDPVDML